jgi:MFS family permease
MNQTNTSILKNRTILSIGLAEAVSNIGDWITMMAIYAILVFKGGGGVAESSGVYLAGLLPALPASLLAGWLCDRVDRKLLMIASQILSGLSVVGLIFTDRLEIIYLLLALEAVFISIMGPARQAVVPQIVAREDLTRANAFFQQMHGIIKIGAPVLAGAVLAVLNPHQAIILDVVSFSLAAIMLCFIRPLPPVKEEKPSASQPDAKASPAGGLWPVLKSLPSLQMVFISVFLAIAVIIGFDVLASVYIRDVLQGNEQFLGLSIGAIGTGTLLATIWLMARRSQISPWWDLVAGLGMIAVIPLVMVLGGGIQPISYGRLLVLAGCLVGGFGNGMVNVQISTLLQSQTPAGILGRMSGLFQSVVTAGQLIGIVLTPLLVPGLISMQGYFSLSAVGMVLLVVFLVVKLNLNRHWVSQSSLSA